MMRFFFLICSPSIASLGYWVGWLWLFCWLVGGAGCAIWEFLCFFIWPLLFLSSSFLFILCPPSPSSSVRRPILFFPFLPNNHCVILLILLCAISFRWGTGVWGISVYN
ncbi:hypothetical protein K440DRAFT_156964 [Wilcoxina mikolae CBS 423.85]|nr:hypothetical protein K440DRAFT_156964 [Wilcoxina mikolae CBS 423.85]